MKQPTQQTSTMILRSGRKPMSPEQFYNYVNDWLSTERDPERIDFLDQALLMNNILNERNQQSCQTDQTQTRKA